MKFHKLGLITAAAVLASIATAGAYTQPVHSIAAPVGSGTDGFSFYIGGAVSTLGGSLQNSQNVIDTTTVATYTTSSTSPYSPVTAANYTGSYANYSVNETLTTSSLKFGGEAHLGAYFGVAEGFGLAVEAFGVTRTSFNPTSSVTVSDTSTSTTAATTTATTSSAPYNYGDTISYGVNVKPNSLGYGVRFMPTVMISDQFGMFASVGYGSQKVTGSLQSSYYSMSANAYQNASVGSTYAPGTVQLASGNISKNLSGINYGAGSFFNVDETISVYSGFEVQKFKTYDTTALNAASVTSAAALYSGTSSTQVTYYVPTETIANATASSSLKLQLNTYSVGIDYAFA